MVMFSPCRGLKFFLIKFFLKLKSIKMFVSSLVKKLEKDLEGLNLIVSCLNLSTAWLQCELPHRGSLKF